MEATNIKYKYIENQKGITLVELLAALLLASVVIVIIMTSFSIGIKHNASESKKVLLQQEANLILATITNKHRAGDCYNLTVKNKKLFLLTCGGDEDGSVTNNLFEYQINTHGFSGNPKKEDLTLELIVIDPENDHLNVIINSTISRIKTEKEE